MLDFQRRRNLRGLVIPRTPEHVIYKGWPTQGRSMPKKPALAWPAWPGLALALPCLGLALACPQAMIWLLLLCLHVPRAMIANRCTLNYKPHLILTCYLKSLRLQSRHGQKAKSDEPQETKTPWLSHAYGYGCE